MASLLGNKTIDANIEIKDKEKPAPKPMPIPAFSDIAKSANDLLNKDFYHAAAANLEVKLKAPNGVNVTSKGKSAHDGPLNASVEGKVEDKANGITSTLTWATANTIDGKLEFDQNLAKDLKVEVLGTYKPLSPADPFAVKSHILFKNPAFHARTFVDWLKGPVATVDAVVGHEGFLLGGETSYDVQKAALTKYSAALGYHHPSYAAAVTATNNMSNFAASYFHKVSGSVQAGTRATYDGKSAGTVGMEIAGRYQMDPLSFVKGKVDNKGLAALSYSTKMNQGVTLGVGASFDIQKLNEAGHKIGADLKFEG